MWLNFLVQTWYIHLDLFKEALLTLLSFHQIGQNCFYSWLGIMTSRWNISVTLLLIVMTILLSSYVSVSVTIVVQTLFFFLALENHHFMIQILSLLIHIQLISYGSRPLYPYYIDFFGIHYCILFCKQPNICSEWCDLLF